MHVNKSEINTIQSDTQIVIPQSDSSTLPTKNQSYFIINTFVTITIYLFTFFIWYYLKRETIIVTPEYGMFLTYYMISLFISSILSNKLFLTREHEYLQSLRKIYISVFLSLGFLSLYIIDWCRFCR